MNDSDGYPLAGDGDSIALFDHAVDAVSVFDPLGWQLSAQLSEVAPAMAMGASLATYLAAMSSDRADLDAQHGVLSAVDGHGLTEREAGHLLAAQRCQDGDLWGAGQVLAALSIEYPRDHLALLIGHQIDFFTGNARMLRDRPARTLPSLDTSSLRYGHVLGMWSFGLVETGQYHRGELVGLDAVGRDPQDRWGIHGVAHAYEMRGLADQGLALLGESASNWVGVGGLEVHLAWHEALFALDLGDRGPADALIDRVLVEPLYVLETLDAAALMWRMYLDGAPDVSRAAALLDQWPARQGWYVFNDLHAVLCAVVADRLGDAAAIADSLEAQAARNPVTTNDHMVRAAGARLARALVLFGQNRDDEAVEILFELVPISNVLGGSFAQRDAWERTLLEAARRADRPHLYRAMLAERIGCRDGGPWNLRRWSELTEAG